MSVVFRVIYEQNELLSYLSNLVPAGHKLLYEQVIEPDEVPIFEGIYLLVKTVDDNSERFTPVRSLVIKLINWQDGQQPLKEIREWLMAGTSKGLLPNYFCDFLERRLESDDSRPAYYPNRFPKEFYYFAQGNQKLLEEDLISFIELFT